LIAQVEPHSPAHDVGLRKGDIIEEAGGKRINDLSDISSLVRKKHVHEELAVTINRYGKYFEISIQLQARP
jgi:S1-C subfamily serine protease